MKSQRVGYVKVNTFDGNVDRQSEEQALDRTFTDMAWGKSVDRPQLEVMFTCARKGDTVVFHSFHRLARNLDDLQKLIQALTKRGIHVEFVQESLTFAGDDSPPTNLMLSIMSAFAEFQRALIQDRQRRNCGRQARDAYPEKKRPLPNESRHRRSQDL